MARNVILFESGASPSIWITDGTAADTRELAAAVEVGLFPFYVTPDFTVLDGEVLFASGSTQPSPPFSFGNEDLWVTDGTTAGTHEITGISGTFAGGYKAFGGLMPRYLTVFNGEVLFEGDFVRYLGPLGDRRNGAGHPRDHRHQRRHARSYLSDRVRRQGAVRRE